MSFCTNCGSMIIQGSKFCGNCGTPSFVPTDIEQKGCTPQDQQSPNNSPRSANAPMGPAPIVQSDNAFGEVVLGIVPLRQMKALGRFDSYVGVVTNHRLIVAQLTKQMINESVTNARKEAKAQGKGYMGQISSQMREFSSGYTTRFLSMTPSSILYETPGNFEMVNGSISEIRLRLNRASHDENSVRSEYEVSIFYGGSKYEYRTDERTDYLNLLRSVYGDRLRTR